MTTTRVATRGREHTTVRAGDGALLHAFSAGDRHRPAVVIAPACGMPVALSDPWISALAAHAYVLTWETRCLAASDPHTSDDALVPDDFDTLGHDAATQANDLLTVLDHFGVERAHAAGFCGGAVLALQAAAAQPGRFSSLSLWHGDFPLLDAATTAHQRNLNAILAMAAASRDTAAELLTMLRQLISSQAPPHLAELLLHPYASAERFHRYSKLNTALTTTDLAPLLPRITVPALVVTAATDATTHPAGSRAAARLLPGAELAEAPEGAHLDAFDATPAHQSLLRDFLTAHP
ncbi:alpha/beta fold hydrolase [Streptomyces monticola]|uniref:Alpha/beta fold hydrolase n=1 Tax=Streptomyces monticola TaxID=2666263 RepID=A0ABW2JVA3_9ACTN